jgi:hypothetical protein
MAGMMCWVSAFCVVVAMFAGYKAKGLDTILYIAAVLAPVAGWFLHDPLDHIVGKSLKGIFWSEASDTAPAHSQGEALIMQAKYDDAIEWFAQKALADPGDWRAQAKLVELFANHRDDPDRLAEERTRLMKTEGVPQGLWVQTAFEHAEHWVATERYDRAVHTYQGILWKFPEDDGAEAARERIEALRATGKA